MSETGRHEEERGVAYLRLEEVGLLALPPVADVQQPGARKKRRRDAVLETRLRPSPCGGGLVSVPDVLSGQDVQQPGHVSGTLPQLHGELTDPVVQHQGPVHALPHQLQLHVGAAHHDGNPTHTHTHTQT
ncbi:hypothetical protein EYF80_017425 [Liparis tanakae]|uniref:Uncharacterized protein n=1 Tax=Liparis tanakae TaxID=230148 RepID=A0A4Z2I2U0_9TELE|nr:hypothetical protein EYF80_017425 [Liparis tanakae]